MPLSNKQMEYLALAWQCFESEPKIDYEKFHRIAGLASPHSARELMRVTKKKLKEEYGALTNGSAPSTPKKATGGENGTPGTSKERKRAAASDDGTPVSGKKRGRVPKKTSAFGLENAGGSEGELEGELEGEGNEGRKAKRAKVESPGEIGGHGFDVDDEGAEMFQY